MPKISTVIGFSNTTETAPGVWTDTIIEKPYVIEVLDNRRRWSPNPDTTNSEFAVSMSVSIIANAFAKMNFSGFRYVVYMGTKWVITDAKPEYPRIILTLGGKYNG